MNTTKPKAYSYIRFSTPEQKKGDSLRRQIEAANNYKKEHNLELVSLRDMGISGHSGAHITKGELGQFLEWIEDGKVERDSRLLIENIDRLSRQPPSEALSVFLSIVNAGVKLVILYGNGYNREITKESFDNESRDYYEIMGELRRAYGESKYKSERLKDAWQEKRNRAIEDGKKLSKKSPQWLEPIEDEKGNLKGFRKRDGKNGTENVVKAIQLMFQKKASGKKGAAMITRELNQMEGIYKPENGWAKSTINKYLRGKAVLGHFELHTKKNGKRKPTGEVIKDYYPPIIEPELWNRANEVFKENAKKKGNAGGNTGAESNLFRHISVICAKCNEGKMSYKNHGKWEYLRCKKHQRNNGCSESRSVRYDSIFEPLMLEYCRNLVISDILPNNEKRQMELADLGGKLQAVNGELEELKKAIKNRDKAIDMAENERTIQRHNKKLDSLYEQQEKKEREKKDIETRYDDLSTSSETTAERLKNIQELIERLDEVEGDERIDLRIILRGKLERLIEQIKIGFWQDEEGVDYTIFTTDFKDGVRQILVLINDKPDEFIIIDKREIDIQDIERARQGEADKRVKINDPRTEK